MRTPRVVPVHAAGTVWVALVDLDVQVVISSVTVLQPHQETHVRRQPHGVWIALNLTPHTATQSSHALYCLAPNSGRMAVCVCVCCVCVCARARARALGQVHRRTAGLLVRPKYARGVAPMADHTPSPPRSPLIHADTQ